MEKENKLKDSTLQFFHDLFDLMVVNILWLLCSLPVITAGPATCGLYHVTLRLARQETVNPVKDFFRGFKINFKQGLLLGLVTLGIAVSVGGDVWFSLQQKDWLGSLYLVLAVLMASVGMIFISYTFALQTMFDVPLKTQILNSFKLAVIAPGKTVMLWLILLLPVVFFLILPPIALKMLGFLYLVAGVSGPVYGASRILRNIFDHANGAPVVEQPTIEE